MGWVEMAEESNMVEIVRGLMLIACVMAYGAEADTLGAINDRLHENFTADGTRPPGLGSLDDIRTGDEPFEGNCVTFALAAYYQLDRAGLEPVLVGVRGRHRGEKFWHLIACSHSDDWCLDNEAAAPYRGADILGRYSEIERIFTVSGDVFSSL